jgi:hypothetical protein
MLYRARCSPRPRPRLLSDHRLVRGDRCDDRQPACQFTSRRRRCADDGCVPQMRCPVGPQGRGDELETDAHPDQRFGFGWRRDDPGRPENGIDIISSTYIKDPTDPRWDNDAGMKEWRAFMAKYYPDGDLKDLGNISGFGLTHTMLAVLKQCSSDFSRENMLKQATNLHDLENPVVLPGIKINTSPSNYRPIRQLQLMRWTGKTWDLFGDLIAGANA